MPLLHPTHVTLQPATTLPRAAQKRKRKDEKESKKSKKSKKEKKGKDKKEKKGKDKKEKRSKRDKERAKLLETATGAHHCRPATDRTPVPTAPLRRRPRRRWVGQVRYHQGGRHVHEAGGVPLLAGRRQGGHPLYSPTILTTDLLTAALLSMAPLGMALLTTYVALASRRASCMSTAASGT